MSYIIDLQTRSFHSRLGCIAELCYGAPRELHIGPYDNKPTELTLSSHGILGSNRMVVDIYLECDSAR